MNSRIGFKGKLDKGKEKYFAGNINFVGNHYFYGIIENDDVPLTFLDRERANVILGKKQGDFLNFIIFNPGEKEKIISHLYIGNSKEYNGSVNEMDVSSYDFMNEKDLDMLDSIESRSIISYRQDFLDDIKRIKVSQIEKALSEPWKMEGGKNPLKSKLKLLTRQYKIVGEEKNPQLKLDLGSDLEFPSDGKAEDNLPL